MTAEDSELLRHFADNQDEEAFAELVRRYLNLVYFAALRQVGHDSHRAEDVAQSVFTELARKASSLVRHKTLAGWLHTTTRYVASEVRRTERRRLAREQEAQAMETSANDPASSAEWERLRPIIDDTLDELSARDREAVLLRFFTNLPHAQIGLKLGVSENTARMRVERALEKLHTALMKRGITSTAAALSLVLANQALAAPPLGLATSVTSAALAAAAKGAIATATTATATKIFSFMSTSKLTLAASGLVTLTAALLIWQQWQTNTDLRHDITALRQQSIALQAENQQLIAERKAEKNNVHAGRGEPSGLSPAGHANNNQLTGTTDAKPSGLASRGGGPAATAPTLTDMIPMDLAAKKSGRSTPTDAARTLLWYLQGGDIKHAADLLAFAPAEKDKLKDFIDSMPENLQDTYNTPAKLTAFAMAGTPKPIAGVQLLSETQPDDYTSIQHVRLQYQDGVVREDDILFHRDVDGWKEVVSPATVDRVIASLKKKQ